MTNEDHGKLLAAVGKAVDWVGEDTFKLHKIRLTKGVGSLDYAVAIGLHAQVAYIAQQHEQSRMPNLMAGSFLSLATFVSLACAHPVIQIPKSMPYDKSQLWLAWSTATPNEVTAAIDRVLELLGAGTGITGVDADLADLMESPRMSWASRGDA